MPLASAAEKRSAAKAEQPLLPRIRTQNWENETVEKGFLNYRWSGCWNASASAGGER
jgi:hypothetical protein